MTDDPEITDPRDPLKRRDIVAELDRQLLHWHDQLLERARDEIVALRQLQLANVEGNKWLRDNDERVFLKAIDVACTEAREQALDEAVQACTDQTSDDPPPGTYNDACEDCAAAIRALRDKA